MNEAGYIRSVNRHLGLEVYKWKVNDRFIAGVPDCWYSGCSGSLWVEYKYLPKAPKKHTAKLSGPQRVWLDDRFVEGRNVAVIVGSPQGGTVLTGGTWSDQFLFKNLLKPKEVAKWITSQVASFLAKVDHHVD